MLGFGEQIPFGCIGQVDEVRMAFQFCRLKGIKGKAMEIFEAEVAAEFDAQKLDITSNLLSMAKSTIMIFAFQSHWLNGCC